MSHLDNFAPTVRAKRGGGPRTKAAKRKLQLRAGEMKAGRKSQHRPAGDSVGNSLSGILTRRDA